jgi:hypothetical protein
MGRAPPSMFPRGQPVRRHRDTKLVPEREGIGPGKRGQGDDADCLAGTAVARPLQLLAVVEAEEVGGDELARGRPASGVLDVRLGAGRPGVGSERTVVARQAEDGQRRPGERAGESALGRPVHHLGRPRGATVVGRLPGTAVVVELHVEIDSIADAGPVAPMFRRSR